jgi:hypothetical protein
MSPPVQKRASRKLAGLVTGSRLICSTFYTQPKPEGSFGPGHRNVALTPEEGMLILDVVTGEIACVEVLDRKDVRRKLDEVLP